MNNARIAPYTDWEVVGKGKSVLGHDVNFRRTFQRIKERRYLETIRNALPQTDKVKKVYDQVTVYLLVELNAKGN